MIPLGPLSLLLILMTSVTTSFNLTTNANDTFPDTTNFNPMELYVDMKEGVSLAFDQGNGQEFAFCLKNGYENNYNQFGNSFKSNAVYEYTRILVGPSKGSNIYPLQYTYLDVLSEQLLSEVVDIVVHQNNDGTVALSCVDSGLYATWGNTQSGDGSWYSEAGNIPMCTESGVCPRCKYSLVIGSINDISISIVDLKWGEPEEAIPSSPSQVAEDYTDNYTDSKVTTTLTVQYTSTNTDTTIWEHAWGFEYSVEASLSVNIPFVGGGSITTTATTSYNGKYGTENTVTDAEMFEEAKEVTCPGRTRCILKYVASKLDNYNMPFSATVERTQDEGPPIQWEEEGVWRGVQAFNFRTVYCSESLETGVSNCPTFGWIK